MLKTRKLNVAECSPKKLGISFSGGAERGIIHLGVIKAFIELGFKPNYIVGVSAGSLIAAIYAYDPTDLEMVNLAVKIIKNLKPSDFGLSVWQIISRVLGERFQLKSLGDLKKFREILDKNLPFKNFQDSKIPFAIVATNRLNGQEVWFNKGSVIDAIIASSSLPVAFPAYKIDDNYYVDGGVTDGLPLFKLAQEGCGKIIGVNLGYAGKIVKPPKNLLENLLGSINIMSYQSVRYEADLMRALYPKLNVVEIKPQVAFDIPLFNLTSDQVEPIINESYEFTKKFLLENKLV